MLGNVALVLLTVLLLQLLLGAVWVGGHWALDLPARAARHWGGSAVLGALALAGVLLRDEGTSVLPIIASNLLMVASALALVRGMRLFLGLAPRDREAAALGLLALTGSVGVALLPVATGGRLQALSTSALLLWLFGRAALDGGRALAAEFGRRTAALLVLPLLGAAGMAALRLVGALAAAARPLQVDTVLHVVIALVLLMVVLLVHGSMAAMVVLRLVARLRRLSQHDALTGLLNRGEWLRRQQAQHDGLARHGAGYALLLLDLDHFKRVNDTWGHPAGDQVLVALAGVLAGLARPGDVAGRLGGEEFALLLPRTGAAAAMRVAERLRRQLGAAAPRWQQQVLRVTVSVGVAAVDDAAEPPGQALERADRALYAAKRAGRDRAVLAPAAAAAGQAARPGAPPGLLSAGG